MIISELVQLRLGILFLIIVVIIVVVVTIIIMPKKEIAEMKKEVLEENNDFFDINHIRSKLAKKNYGSYDPPQRYRETQLYEESLGRGEINSGLLWGCRMGSPCGKCSVCQRNGDGY